MKGYRVVVFLGLLIAGLSGWAFPTNDQHPLADRRESGLP